MPYTCWVNLWSLKTYCLSSNGPIRNVRHDCKLTSRVVCSNLEVDYGSEEIARIVSAALAVDKELQPDKVKRQMLVSNGKLSVHFEAVEARFLRASYSAFLDILTLATKTIEEFGQGMTL